MILEDGMYVLLLNDMRSPKIEMVEAVVCDKSEEAIRLYCELLRVEPYKDGVWGKVFRKGSALEWYNCRFTFDTDNERIVQYRTPDPPDVPSIVELGWPAELDKSPEAASLSGKAGE